MRLLNARTVRLEDVASIPPYAILSHTWARDEVTFQDMQGSDMEAGRKEGYAKIVMACQQALFDGLEYVWIDTCCIDKSDQEEVSETIQTMFKWYERSSICYIYLDDVPNNAPIESASAFGESHWFTRSWTLQELIAPWELRFYSVDWKVLGDRRSFARELGNITGIPDGVLLTRQFLHLSVAARMSWAASRTSAVEEDVAYSLQGIFGVRMSPSYGEGAEEAFRRLQENILRSYQDDSIFAWKEWSHKWDGSALAKSPTCFRGCHDIHTHASGRAVEVTSLMDERVRICIPRKKVKGVLYGLLRCGAGRSDGKNRCVAIPLLHLDDGSYSRGVGPVIYTRLTKWARLRASTLVLV